MDVNNEVYQKLQEFANKHKVVFVDEGSVGFGRACVGFTKGGGYVDFNPIMPPDYKRIFPNDEGVRPDIKDVYHKHDCFAVLVHDEDYDEGLRQLCSWIDELETKGGVDLIVYPTGNTGIQAALGGMSNFAFRLKSDREKHGIEGEL